jgi:hypothetical protein
VPWRTQEASSLALIVSPASRAASESSGSSDVSIVQPEAFRRVREAGIGLNRLSAGREFTEKLTRLAEVLGIKSPHNHLEEIFELALESALDKKDPKRKLERRREREARKQSPRPRPGDAESPAPTRHIPSEVRERVLKRTYFYGQDFIQRKIDAARRERVAPPLGGAS